MNTNGCPPHAKYLAKSFDTLIKTIYMLLYTTEHSHPAFLTIYLIQNLMLNCFNFFLLSDYHLMISESS